MAGETAIEECAADRRQEASDHTALPQAEGRERGAAGDDEGAVGAERAKAIHQVRAGRFLPDVTGIAFVAEVQIVHKGGNCNTGSS